MIEDKIDPEILKIIHDIRRDPWEFSKYVFTLDEADKDQPIKRFPYHLDYIKLYFRVLMRENLMAVPKSRRVKMTWTNCVFIVWDTLFHQGRHNAIVSKKEEDADFLLQKRCKFIIENLDKRIPRALIPSVNSKYCHIDVPQMNSKIQGFPQGEDQLRQFTLSNILADEFAFWEKAEATYGASKPTLDGGGRFIGVSSQAPGFFEQLVKDCMDISDLTQQTEESTPAKRHPMQGVQIWKNKNNKFCVYQLHYTADPDKRSEDYKEGIKKGMPYKQYMMEYELSWEKFAGLPVFPDFNEQLHGSKERLRPWFGLPLLIGFDFGLTPACVIAQMQVHTLCILKEFVAVNMGIERFLSLVIPQLRMSFPQWSDLKRDYMCFVDPAGFAKKDTDEKTCAMFLADPQIAGFVPSPGGITWTERKESVNKFLTRIYQGKPCFQVNVSECPVLVRGFNGGYQYAEGQDKLETLKVRPLKNEYSHVHDSLQMITTKILEIQKKMMRTIPGPKYGFTG